MPHRSDYRAFIELTTRWMDNDIYGHVNNVVYYSYFDTAVNRFLIERGVLDIHGGDTIGYVVESTCRYERPLSFPDRVAVGLRVVRVGNTSVQYEIGIFRNDEESSCADGRFVHVYVDRSTERPSPIPDAMRQVLSSLQVQ